jgi:hypothetical protein
MRCGGFFFGRCKGQRSQGVIDWELDEIKQDEKKPLNIAASGFLF